MGVSSAYALKVAADTAIARGDIAEGKRLMREYTSALARAEKEKTERERKKVEEERRKVEAKKKKIEEAQKKIR